MFKRAALEGFKNLSRTFWLSATAISVLIVSLTSVALVASITTVIGYSVRNLDQLVTISAFIRENVAEEDIEGIKIELESINRVARVEYVDQEEAQRRFEEEDGVLNKTTTTGESNQNLAFRYFIITPKTSDDYKSVFVEVNSDQFSSLWEAVPGSQDFVDQLVRINTWIRIVGVVLIVVFASISILVMSNILRMIIYSHKEEIEIMRLVGATNTYIRVPYIAEGVYYNLIATFVVTALFIPIFRSILPKIQEEIGGSFSTASRSLAWEVYAIFGITIFSGVLVGVLTSYFATQRYLKL